MPVAKLDSEHLVVWLFVAGRRGVQLRTTGGIPAASAQVPEGLVDGFPKAVKVAKNQGLGRILDDKMFHVYTYAIRDLAWSVRYHFPLRHRKKRVHGYPAGYSAPVFQQDFSQFDGQQLVWASRKRRPITWWGLQGYDRVAPRTGWGVEPMHSQAVELARESPGMYDLLAALDLLRSRSARARGVAERHVDALLRDGIRS